MARRKQPLNNMVMRAKVAGLSILIGLALADLAGAYSNMTCALAMMLVADHQGIEANSIMAVAEWQAMDRETSLAGSRRSRRK
jgi:hypothetical protein